MGAQRHFGGAPSNFFFAQKVIGRPCPKDLAQPLGTDSNNDPNSLIVLFSRSSIKGTKHSEKKINRNHNYSARGAFDIAEKPIKADSFDLQLMYQCQNRLPELSAKRAFHSFRISSIRTVRNQPSFVLTLLLSD